MDSFILLQEDDLKELGLRMGQRKLLVQWISSANTNQNVAVTSAAAASSNTTAELATIPSASSSRTSELSQVNTYSEN